MDKSLVTFEEQESAGGRYRLLEMVRQYAAESLEASGEIEQIRRKHRDWFVAFAEEAEPQLKAVEQELSLRRLETEHENLRAALGWCSAEENGAQAGLRLAGALGRFWEVRGYPTEGREYLAEALGREAAAGRTLERARALNWAGILAWRQGDYASARSLHEESLAIQRELGDRKGVAASLNNLGIVASEQSDYASARSLYEEALTLNREYGNRVWEAINLVNLGILAHRQSDYALARSLHEESLAIRRELGDRQGIAYSFNNLGTVASKQGDYASARSLHEESLAIRRELGDRHGIAESLGNLGDVAIVEGDYASAFILHEQSLRIKGELENKYGIAETLEAFAILALKAESGERAARLWGAVSALRESIGSRLPPNEQEDQERDMAAARAAIGEAAFATAWEEGRAIPLEQAIKYALERSNSSSYG